jgi:hypothetical protein
MLAANQNLLRTIKLRSNWKTENNYSENLFIVNDNL